MESCRDELSLATLIASDRFTDLDWAIAEFLHDADDAAVLDRARELAAWGCDVEAEALVHARRLRTRAVWARPYARRWREVRDAISAFEAEGLAVPFGDLTLIVNSAYRVATGASQDEVEARFPDLAGAA